MPAMLTPRVMLVNFNPAVPSAGSRKLNQALGWNDPDALVEGYINDIFECSYGHVRYEIVERYEINHFPIKQDGFQYDADGFVQAWRARAGFHQPDTADYAALLQVQADLLRKIDAGEIDEFWMMGFPYAGFYESCMGGRGAVWCNGPVIPNTGDVSRKFVVMGFNYERGVGEMLEAFGHRCESILDHVWQGVPDALTPAQRAQASRSFWSRLKRFFLGEEPPPVDASAPPIDLNANLWKQFTRYDKTHPGLSGCGIVHYAPSSDIDYDWGNRRPVMSCADAWLNYPDINRPARVMTCDEWGGGEIRAHHKWWLQHFPHTEGETPTGRLNNWWEYVVGLKF